MRPWAARPDRSIQVAEQLVDQCLRLVSLDMKSIVGHLPGRIDNHGPGGAPRALTFHDLQRLAGVGIAGRMRHGDFQGILDLVLPEFVWRVETVAFEYRLNGDEFDPIVVRVSLRDLPKCREPRLAAPRSPVLEKIEVNHAAPVIPQANGSGGISIAVDLRVQIQFRRLAAQDTVFCSRRRGLQSDLCQHRQRSHGHARTNQNGQQACFQYFAKNRGTDQTRKKISAKS